MTNGKRPSAIGAFIATSNENGPNATDVEAVFVGYMTSIGNVMSFSLSNTSTLQQPTNVLIKKSSIYKKSQISRNQKEKASRKDAEPQRKTFKRSTYIAWSLEDFAGSLRLRGFA
jgi:hypothetical protein